MKDPSQGLENREAEAVIMPCVKGGCAKSCCNTIRDAAQLPACLKEEKLSFTGREVG